MNIVVIFAGGTGKRMNVQAKPKQFLELYGKPILVYTLEQFQQHEEIDKIIVVCLEEWIGYCQELMTKYHLDKVDAIIPGGSTGQESICNGVQKAHEMYPDDSVVLIHDGVRPIIDAETISKDIASVRENGSAITVAPAIETVTVKDETGAVGEIIDRSRCQLAKAPQCFVLKDLMDAHNKATADDLHDFIDTACLMRHYGYPLTTVEGPSENIKITTMVDYYVLRAIIDSREKPQEF